MRRHRRQVVRVEKEDVLQAEERVEEEREDGAEDEHRLRVALPVLLLGGIRADDPVEAALEGRQAEAPAHGLGGVDASHVEAERQAEGDQDDRVEDRLGDGDRAHSFSPRKSA